MPTTRQGYWADLPSRAFRDLDPTCVAVLPVGATEQHGPHLPLRVDCLIPDAIAARMIDRLDEDVSALVLPTLAVTKSTEHRDHPGTLTLSANTLLAVVMEIGASVARAGVQRLLLLNGHGGNTALLEVAARELRIETGMAVVSMAAGGLAGSEPWGGRDLTHDIHAGFAETSAVLALRPELVDMGRARDFAPAMPRWAQAMPGLGLVPAPVRPGWIMDDVNAEGASGDAAAADAATGARFLDAAAQGLARFVADFARSDYRAAAAADRET